MVVDKYRITRLLGRGGMGSVYEAQHTVLGRRFAVKFMLPEYATNRDTLRRFENEAKAAGQLEHPNIAAVTDLGRAHDGSPYLVMEYLTGQDCSKLLANVGPLPVPRAVEIVRQACLGLSMAHQAGIVHRDIKPENLFVTSGSDGHDLVKIVDFGIAKLRLPDASAVTGSGVAMGTFFYMAPEQVRDAGKVDSRADVWALGVVLYELLTGNKPFDGSDATKIMYQIVFEPHEPAKKLRDDIPVAVASAVDVALKKNPDERYNSALAFADAIAPFGDRPSYRPSNAAPARRAERLTPVSTSYHATTSHASVATLSQHSVLPTPSARRKRAYFIYASLVAAALTGLSGAWLMRKFAHGAEPRAAAVPTDSALAPEHVSDSRQSSAHPAAEPALSSLAPAASQVSNEHDVRTKSEVSARNSNNAPATQNRAAPARPAESAAASVTVHSPQPPETVPEQHKSNTHNPVSIDTNSPY